MVPPSRPQKEILVKRKPRMAPTTKSFHSSKLPLIILLCAFAVPILTGVLGTDGAKIRSNPNAWEQVCYERTTDCFTQCSENEYGDFLIERICSNGDIEPVYGDFSWRYFQRGTFEGARLSGLRYFFRPWLGYEQGNYADRLLNPLNPTPFLITVFLFAASWIVRVYDNRHMAEEEATGFLSALNRCEGCGNFHSPDGLQKIDGKGYLCASCRSAAESSGNPS